MASRAVQWSFVLFLAAGSVWAQINPIQACSVTAPNGPSDPDRPPIGNPNLDFHWSCEAQGQRCIFVPDILNPALKADLKYFDWSWGTNPPVTWRRYKIQEVRYDYPVLDTTYYVTLTATFHSGQVETVAKNVHIVVDPPSAYFAYNNVFYGLSLHLETPIGDPATHRYYWDFGDGTVEPYGPYKCLCKTYEKPGQYKITLTVLNATLNPPTEVSSSRFIDVPNLVPEATYSFTSNYKTFTFDASGSRDEPPFNPAGSTNWPGFQCGPCSAYRTNTGLTFDWDFGDGSFATGMSPAHQFTVPGTHAVRLTATDRAGAVTTVTKTVTVPNDAPVAALDFSCNARTCRFDASRSTDDGGVQTYKFDFGDGTAPVVTSEPYVTRTYTADNYYTVTVKANDGTLESAAASRVATINADFQSPGLFYFTTEPCRIFDSRMTPPALTSGVTRTIPIAGKCQIPYTALAVAANVTAVSPNAIGYLRTFRPGDPLPIASALNWTPDRAPRSNNITVAIANDSINVQPTLFPPAGTTGTTELLIDVVGFYSTDIVPFAGPKGPLMFQSLATPCRIFDSRSVPGSGITNPTPSYLKVQGKCGIPDLGASGGAAALNLAMVGATSDGSVNVYPSTMAAPPNTTTVNFRSAVMNHANAINAPLGQRLNDDIAMVYNSSAAGATTQYAVDTSGYFSASGTQYFHPVRPCRAVDTRRPERGESRMVTSVVQDFQIKGNCGVPGDATAVLVNAAVVQPDGGGNLLLWPAGTPEPLASSVNFTPAENAIANTLIVPLGVPLRDLSAKMSFNAGHLALDVFGYFTSTYSGLRTPAENKER
jgi:PKD repeat protein